MTTNVTVWLVCHNIDSAQALAATPVTGASS